MKIRTARFTVFVLGLLVSTTAAAHAQGPNGQPCAAPEYRQFDFWLGDWDVYDIGSAKSNARVRVDSILDGCVLREHYEDGTGMVGESFTIFDSGRKTWHQTWVTNRGRLLTIEGGSLNGSIVLSGAYYLDNAKEVRVRGTWTPVADGVRESALTSADGGKTWKPWFDLLFRRREPRDNTSGGDAVTAVGRLDEEFQAAVKRNDAQTIDRILADNFILVTGSGKVFNKQEILEEARRRTTTYEHQEDTERTVRVWGDSAVVTAKLWIKGVRDGTPIDYTLWFSDTYVKTAAGWKYVFGQASLPLPEGAPAKGDNKR
jgi:ketosteroid isomerase-like protein